MASVPPRPPVTASARTTITFDELAREFSLSDRSGSWGNVPRDATGALQLDGIRARPRYFDGKFLTAHDLTRDQLYIRQRQDDLARATGVGVVCGLEVTIGASGVGDTVTIQPGHGVTPSGAIVSIVREREIALLDIAGSRQLDQVFNLSSRPAIPVASRTGLFMLALRPVEFTANPTGSYPDAATGERLSEPGDLIEATAITLIAYEGAGGAQDLTRARALAARDIFGREPGPVPEDALLLAMLALDRGTVVWCDPMLVRRETGADSPLALGFGGRRRPVSEAFLLQYQQHLSDVMKARAAGGENPSFSARDHFAILPPAGPMPLGAVLAGADSLEQAWFPPEVEMQVSFIPEDEIGAVVEDSLSLEPIDLTRGDLSGLAVSALVPLPRHKLHGLAASLKSLSMPIASPAAAMGGSGMFDGNRTGQRAALTVFRPGSILESGEAAQLALWEAALQDAALSVPRDASGHPVIFYTRQRTAPHAATLTGHSVRLLSGALVPAGPTPTPGPNGTPTPTPTPGPGPAPTPPAPLPNSEEMRESVVEEKAAAFQLKTRLASLRKLMVAGASSALTDLLAQEAMREVLFTNLIRDLEIVSPAVETDERLLKLLRSRSAMTDARLRLRSSEGRLLSKTDVATVGADYRREDLGMGLRMIAKVGDEALLTGRAGVWLGDTTLGIVIDQLLSSQNDRRVQKMAKALAEAIGAQDEKLLRDMVAEFSGSE